MQTTMGRRVIDNFSNSIARESKVGATSLTKFIQKQIAKDAELLNKGAVKGVEWHFFRSKTGIGPSGPLRKALEDAGFKIFIH